MEFSGQAPSPGYTPHHQILPSRANRPLQQVDTEPRAHFVLEGIGPVALGCLRLSYHSKFMPRCFISSYREKADTCCSVMMQPPVSISDIVPAEGHACTLDSADGFHVCTYFGR